MSKRKGVFITIDELIDEVGADVARFFFLARSPDTHMDFDLDLAKKQSSDNPVYYVKYAHARISNIIKKAKGIKLGSKFNLLSSFEEQALMKKLILFPDIVGDTARDYQAHRLTRYAVELARVFHGFYEKHKVITDDNAVSGARLALVSATQIVLQNIFSLLNIDAPEKM